MKIKSIFCGLVCLCILSGCKNQPEQISTNEFETITAIINESDQTTTSESENTTNISKLEHSSTNDSESETISTESDTDREMQSTIENSSESTVQSTNNASDNLSTSGNQSEQASNSVTETKHSSPENAIKEYCQTFSDKNVEACKKIVPPDYLYYIDENKEENPNAGWWLGTGENNSDKIRVTEFKQNIKLERGEEMYEWYLNYYTAIKSTNAEKITMYTTSTIVDFGYGEEQTESDFFCVFENGKWYAVIAD